MDDKQMEYNQIHGITPTQIRRAQTAIASKQTIDYAQGAYYDEVADIAAASDPIVAVMNEDQIRNAIERSRMLMRQAAEKMDFILAAQYRDEMLKYAEML